MGVRGFVQKFGFDIVRVENRFVSLKSEGGNRGDVLVSYVIRPFFLRDSEPIPNDHTNHWESLQIARTFLDLGYNVDVVDYKNKTFIPKKDYSIFVGHRTNFQRTAQLLNRDCLKILHIDTANWLFNNSAEYRRCLEVQQKRGVSLKSFRPVEPNWAIEYADCATILGNDFTVSTYEYAGKPLFRVPIATCAVYPWTSNKDFDKCRNNFLWFGGKGLVHKGLDLVLEAFAEMPNHRLTVCGGIEKELEFEKAYHRELYQTPNIRTIGWVDVASKNFQQITNECVGLIYPSCSEGGAASVVTCLQAGLIPLLTRESSVDVQDFGFLLNGYSADEIKTLIHTVSQLSSQELESKAHKAWEYARANHTRDNFSEAYKNIINHIVENQDINLSKALSVR